MALEEYNRKRDFGKTSEPRGKAKKSKAGQLVFVVQLHHARARHYDLRLEMDGVLRSWAVPRGPSFRAGEKRLAVETEDHPMAYSHFSGLIPEGEYGAGHMAVFDEGTWEPDGDPVSGYKKGHLDFSLLGARLKGRWTLIRTGQRGSKSQWMLFKRTDEFAADLEADDLIASLPAPPSDAPGASTAAGLAIRARKGFSSDAKEGAGGTSAAKGAEKTVEKKPKTARAAKATQLAKPATANRADRRSLIREAAKLSVGRELLNDQFVAPMLTVASAAAPASDDWLHEWKWDGYRIVAQAGGSAKLWSRNGIPWNDRAPDLAKWVGTLGVSALLDGELIAVDATGYSDFNALQHALKSHDASAMRYVAFDLLALDGQDLRHVPLLERKSLLERLLADADPHLFYSSHIQGHGPEIFAEARKRGMEGIISKRSSSTYDAGRSRDWLKTKTSETREFVVVGYTSPKGSRQGIGALMLARFENGELVYAGRVGSGMGNETLRETHAALRKLEVARPVLDLPEHVPLQDGQIQWVKPTLVVEVVFRGWGKEGLLRQASFHRLRADKPATAKALQQRELSVPKRVSAAKAGAPAAGQVADRGKAANQPAAKTEVAPRRSASAPSRSRTRAVSASADLPTLSSPDRVVYPESGFTKRDVWDYYLAAAPQLLEEVKGRLLSIVRCPQGIDGPHFFQKHVKAAFGASVKPFRVIENDGDAPEYFYIDDVAGLMALVQMNTLEIHPWGSHIATLEQPDRMVFDLDPDPSIEWPAIKTAAKDVRDRLLEAGLESFAKLSGGKGVHVVVPLKPKADWEQVRRFAEAFADAMEARAPEDYVATMSKAKRRERIFIDWLRNGRGATSVASWSLRARPGAPAAVPLTWAELARVESPTRYTLNDAQRRKTPAEVLEIIARAKPLII